MRFRLAPEEDGKMTAQGYVACARLESDLAMGDAACGRARGAGQEVMAATRLDADLPEPLKAIRTRPLFVMRLEVEGPLVVGAVGAGVRRVGLVTGGVFEGERLSGQVLSGGSDWQMALPDGTTMLDVRLLLRTAQDELIAMTYRGVRHGPAEVMAKIGRGEAVDPQSYYFRINPLFESGAARLDWLNRVVAVGAGHRQPDGPTYSVFEVL